MCTDGSSEDRGAASFKGASLLERKTSIVQIPLNGSRRSFVVEEKSEIGNNPELKKMMQEALLNATRGSLSLEEENDHEQEECPICYEEIDGNEGFLTSCPRPHKFHYVCMFRYLRFSSVYKCPFCNCDITYITPLSSPATRFTKEQLITMLISGPIDVTFVYPALFHSAPDAKPLPRRNAAPADEAVDVSNPPTPASKRPPTIFLEELFLPDDFMAGYSPGGDAPPGDSALALNEREFKAGVFAGDLVVPDIVVQLVDKDRSPTPCGVSYPVTLKVRCCNGKVDVVSPQEVSVAKQSGVFVFEGLTLRPNAEGFSYFDMSVTLEFEVACNSAGDVELACDGSKIYGRIVFLRRPRKVVTEERRKPVIPQQPKKKKGGCCGLF